MRGLIHIYTGDGKGKTSAAIGLGVRAAGAGLKVLMLELCKSSGSGEQEFIKKANLGFEIVTACDSVKFVRDMTDAEKAEIKRVNTELLLQAFSRRDIDVLIVDELFFSYNSNLIDRTAAEEAVKNKPLGLELVLTGRESPSLFLALADYVSEIKKIKHPFDRGIPARRGIEF